MSLPLQGLHVLDFSTLLPGPCATNLLADMGASVLRIVSRSRPDLVTLMPPAIPGSDLKAAEAWTGRGKRTMFLNLKHSEARNIVHRLIEKHDIVLEQFRPGVMARLGLDYASLAKVNPGLVYCSLTGYGQTGPMAMRAGHDINYLARSGVTGYSGKKGVCPDAQGIQVADVGSGTLFSVIGILAAVVDRQQSGRGRHVDVAMMDGMMLYHAMRGAAFLVDGRCPEPEDDLLNGGSLYDYYETSDGGYVSVGSLEPAFFKDFCEGVGRPDLVPGTVAPKDLKRVKAEVRDIFKSKTLAEWKERFARLDACVEPVLSLEEALDDPQVKERDLLVDVRLPESGVSVRQIGCPVIFTDADGHRQKRQDYEAWSPGFHTEEVMSELGFTQSDVARLGGEGLFA